MNLIDQYKDIEIVDALEERYLAYALTTIMDRARCKRWPKTSTQKTSFCNETTKFIS